MPVTLPYIYPVYTIQPVVKPVVQLVWQPAVSCKQTSNRLSNPFDNRLNVCIHDTAGCQTGLTTGLTTVLNEQTVRSTSCQTGLYNRLDKHGLTTVLNKQLVVKPGCTTGLTTGCIHDTAVCQTGLTMVVSCIQTFDNRFDNRLYCVNGALCCILAILCIDKVVWWKVISWTQRPPMPLSIFSMWCDDDDGVMSFHMEDYVM